MSAPPPKSYMGFPLSSKKKKKKSKKGDSSAEDTPLNTSSPSFHDEEMGVATSSAESNTTGSMFHIPAPSLAAPNLFSKARSAYDAASSSSSAVTIVDVEAGEEPAQLMVVVLQAKGLLPMDPSYLYGKPVADPFLELRLGNDAAGWSETKSTSHCTSTLNPIWKDDKYFTLPPSSGGGAEPLKLECSLYDKDTFSGKDFMGRFAVSLDDVPKDGAMVRRWYLLEGTVESSELGSVKAKGKVELMLQYCVKRPPPLKPLPFLPGAMSAPLTGWQLWRLVGMVLPFLLWLWCWLCALLGNIWVSIYEGLAFVFLWAAIYIGTGLRVKIRRINIRFGFASDSPTEIVIYGIEVRNPEGGYCSENLLELERIELHVHIKSVVKALLEKRKRFYTFPIIDVPLISVRGLKLVTEKAYGSPYVQNRKDQMLNLWALLGGSPLTPLTPAQIEAMEKQAKAREKEEKQREHEIEKKKDSATKKKEKAAAKKASKDEEAGLDPDDDEEEEFDDDDSSGPTGMTTEAQLSDATLGGSPELRKRFKERTRNSMGCPFRIRSHGIIIHDVELFAGDLINDLIGGKKPLRSPHAARIKLTLTKAELNHGKPFFLKLLMKRALKKIGLVSIITDVVYQVAHAGGAKISPLHLLSIVNDKMGGVLFHGDQD